MASSNCFVSKPFEFSGKNYAIWAGKMKTYLRAYDLQEVVEVGKEPVTLPKNLTLNQIRYHSEENAKKYKALFAIRSCVQDEIYKRLMNYDTPKKAWDALKEEFQGNKRTKQMQVLNLRREFEVLKMKDSKTIKEYIDKLMKIVNKIRILGEELTERRVVEKVLVSVPKGFEAKISFLEDLKNLTKLTLTDLVVTCEMVF